MDQNIPFSQWPEVPDYDMGEPFYQEGVKWTTRHNFELEKKHIDHVVLHDVTLRDGDQTPGSVFLEDERLRIADALAEMKMPRIEAGMPVVSKAVENAMRRMVARNYPHSKIYGFARAVIGDVDLCKDVGCQGIIIEYCVNPVIIKHAYQKTPQWVVENLIRCINHAKEVGFKDVVFMGWDWFRTPIEFTRPRKNALKLMLLMDSGGSMDYYRELCSLLFQSVSKAGRFKDLKVYYFHNAPGKRLYLDPTLDWRNSVLTEWVMNNIPSDYKVIIVGDAAMNPYELREKQYDWHTRQYGPSGLEWLTLLKKHFPYLVWMNPEPLPAYYDFWSQTHRQLAEMFPMFQLTAEGLEAGMKRLMVRR